jgi:hypothetical protein
MQQADMLVYAKDTSRVTRLGVFSPVGRVFTLGSFMKITEVAQIFVQSFFLDNSYALILKKNCLGCILGNFFHKYLATLASRVTRQRMEQKSARPKNEDT